jgi:hypothetical protein
MVGEIQNQLHPRYCTVIPAGREYVGIKEIVNSHGSMVDTIAIADLPEGTPDEQVNHKALQHIFAEFLILTWLHREHKDIFHTDSEGNTSACKRDSLQFLIHPSSAQAEHSKYYEWVKDLRESWVDMLTSPLLRKKLVDEFILPAFRSVLLRLSEEEQRILATKANTENCLNSIVRSLSSAGSIELKLVNSDERMKLKKIGIEREFLPDDERGEWEGKDWILIGGDILGRGLTIPHLTTTVFLRDPSQPNFDVSMQQMRFLGYRKSYERVIRVCAPQAVIEDYQDAAVISTLSRRRAELWDSKNRDLIDNPDPIVFQSPEGARYRPTRNNVTSVEVNRKQISKTGFFNFSHIVNPLNLDENLSLLANLPDVSFEEETIDKWQVFRMTSVGLHEFLINFKVLYGDKVDFEPFLELLNFDSSNYGLADKNASFLIDKDVDISNLSNFRDKFILDSNRGNLPFVHRGRSILNLGGTGITQKQQADWQAGNDPSQFDSYKVKAIVGDSERAVKDFEPESVRVHARLFGLYEDANTFTNPLGWGLTLIGWTPLTGTQMWIHEGAISE